MQTLRSAAILAVLLLTASHADAQFNVGPSTTPAEDYRVELDLFSWSPTPELAITDDRLAAVGGTVDFVAEFGLGDKRFREIRVTLKPGRKHKVRVSYLPVRYQESAFLVRTVTFGGQTFAVGADAATDIEWDLWRFGYEYDIVSWPGGFAGVIGEVRYNQVAASITTSVGDASTEVNVPVPSVGGVARGYLSDALSVTAEFTAWSLDREEFRGVSYDLDIYGTVNLGANLGVQVGYRSVTAEYLVDADEGDLTLKGLYFGGALRF